MATTTPNFGWAVTTSSDLVKNGATAIETLGDAIDASMVDLKGGTTGQVLSKASNTDMDFSWVAQDDSNAIQNAIVDAKGDLIAATANDTPARLAVGTNGQVLTADSTAATGIKWATPSASASGLTKILTATYTSVANTGTTFDGVFTSTYDNYIILFQQLNSVTNSNVAFQFQLRNGGSTTTTQYNGSYSRGVTLTTTSSASSYNICNLTTNTSQQAALQMSFYRNTTNMSWSYFGNDRGVSNDSITGGGFQNTLAANGADGFILSTSAGTLSGTTTVYGVQK